MHAGHYASAAAVAYTIIAHIRLYICHPPYTPATERSYVVMSSVTTRPSLYAAGRIMYCTTYVCLSVTSRKRLLIRSLLICLARGLQSPECCCFSMILLLSDTTARSLLIINESRCESHLWRFCSTGYCCTVPEYLMEKILDRGSNVKITRLRGMH